MNAFDIIEREIAQELNRHGLWVGGRKCSCNAWEYKAERGQARASYGAMVVAHNHHISQVITKRLLDCKGLPSRKVSDQSGAEQTGKSSTSKTELDPTLLFSTTAGEAVSA